MKFHVKLTFFMLLFTISAAAQSNKQVIFYDDFTGPQIDEDPSCYSRRPVCSTRSEWGNTGQCKHLDSKILEQLKNLNKCRWKIWDSYSVFGVEKVYSFNPSQVKVENGHLILTAAPTNNGAKIGETSCDHVQDPYCAYISGGVDTRPSFGGEFSGFDFRYGKVEIRAKFDLAPGSFPAMWMFESRTPPWEQRAITDPDRLYQEIDILEVFAHEPVIYRDFKSFFKRKTSSTFAKAYQSLHWGKDGFYKDFLTKHQVVNHNDFHVYAVEWSPEKLVFLIDGKKTFELTPKSKKNKNFVKIPNREMHLILDLQLGKGKVINQVFGKKILNDVYELKRPIKLIIDWIKVSSDKKENKKLIDFPHPKLVDGINYYIKNLSNTPYLSYKAIKIPFLKNQCSFGGVLNGTDCLVEAFTFKPLPNNANYIIHRGDKNFDAGVYYNPGDSFFTQFACPNGGYLYRSQATGKSLCILSRIIQNTPALYSGVNYSILAPMSKKGFGVYYPQDSGWNKCPYGGKAMNLHQYYGDDDWIDTCQVMELDRTKIDPLRSIKINMHQNPALRSIEYVNDY